MVLGKFFLCCIVTKRNQTKKTFYSGHHHKKCSSSCQATRVTVLALAHLFEVTERVGTVFAHFGYQRDASYQDSYG